MTYFRNLFITLFMLMMVSLYGCHLIFHPDIEQGNIITPQQIAALHTGMNRQQVEQLLGKPILNNLYAENRMIYIYSLVPGHGQTIKKQLIINFSNNQVSSFNYTTVPPSLAQKNGSKT